MSKVKLYAGGAVLVVALGATMAGILHTKEAGRASGGESSEQAAIVHVKAVHPKKGAVARLCVQPGSVHSFEHIDLYAQVPGYLKMQKVDIGDPVKEGQILAIVDVPDIEARVDRNKAAIERTEAQLDQMNSRLDVAKANLKAAEAAVTQAEANLKSATAWVTYRKLQLARIDNLVKLKSLEYYLLDESKERHDAAVETENAAVATVATSKANVVACTAKIEQAKSDVVEAKAEIKVAQADLKKSKVDLDFATIRAPFDGVVTFRSMNPNDFVRAANGGGSQPLLTVDRTDKFRVIVLVPDRDVEFCHVGKEATMEIDSLPGRTFKATVSRIATALDTNTRLMRVELDLPNPTGKIYHGMYGQVSIVLQNQADTLSIPYSCLQGKPDHNKATIFVAHGGKAKRLQVELGIDTGVRVAVPAGLSENDLVILNPGSALTEELPVTATLTNDPIVP